MKHATQNMEHTTRIIKQRTWNMRWGVFLFAILLALVVVPAVAGADEHNDPVILLAPSLFDNIEGVYEILPDDKGEDVAKVTDLGAYLNGIFLLGIGIASGLAVIYITIGGIQYMTTSALGGKEEGRQKITYAVGGLVLALGAFLILNTINPDLLEFNVEQAIARIVEDIQKEREGRGFDDQIVELWNAEQGEEVREILKAKTNDRVRVNKGECTRVGQSNCTSLAGIRPDFFYDAVKGIADRCNCIIIINGGTEYWLHGNRNTEMCSNTTNHKPGNAVIDLNSEIALNKYITGGEAEPRNVLGECRDDEPFKTINHIDGITYQWEPDQCKGSTGDHWHIELFDDPNVC